MFHVVGHCIMSAQSSVPAIHHTVCLSRRHKPDMRDSGHEGVRETFIFRDLCGPQTVDYTDSPPQHFLITFIQEPLLRVIVSGWFDF